MMIDTHILNIISFQYVYLQCDQIADPCDMFYMLEYTSVSVQGSKQTAHWNASSRNYFLEGCKDGGQCEQHDH